MYTIAKMRALGKFGEKEDKHWYSVLHKSENEAKKYPPLSFGRNDAGELYQDFLHLYHAMDEDDTLLFLKIK